MTFACCPFQMGSYEQERLLLTDYGHYQNHHWPEGPGEPAWKAQSRALLTHADNEERQAAQRQQAAQTMMAQHNPGWRG